MDLPRVDKKLREARYFLTRMYEAEKAAVGDREPFDFNLSAFLSATRTIDYRLRHEQGTLYRPWRANWDATLTADENRLMRFLVDDRNEEVHAGGSARDQKKEAIAVVGGEYRDESGTVYVSAPPGTLPAQILKHAYYFTIDGNERKATDTCKEYLELLARMLAKFKADNP